MKSKTILFAIFMVYLLTGCPAKHQPAPVKDISITAIPNQEQDESNTSSNSNRVKVYKLPSLESGGELNQPDLYAENTELETDIDVYPGLAATENVRPPAVQNLLDDAESAEQAQQYMIASAKLERALRIEPNDAELWNRLAGLRMKQENYEEVVRLASRSNEHAFGNQELKAKNWRLIAIAYQNLGNPEASQSALRQAISLESRVS